MTEDYKMTGKGRPTMNWETRMRIALGSAKGLAYLHEDCEFYFIISHFLFRYFHIEILLHNHVAGHPKIIHRDIKASNILLDLTFEAKVNSCFCVFVFYLYLNWDGLNGNVIFM